MPINSRAKGANNERMVAFLLTGWTGHEFTRIPASGGLRWKNTANICGDLISTDPDFDFIFSIETKFYRNLGLKHTAPYIRRNSCVYRFMNQCLEDAKRSGKRRYPFLMLRENGMPKDLYYIFLPMNLIQHIELIKYLPAQFMGWEQDIIGFRSDKFFRALDYETLKNIYK